MADRPIPAPNAARAERDTGARPAVRPLRLSAVRPAAVVIGVSTGGPQALAEVLPALPADLGVPVLVVQHMPPVFTKLLAERLDTKSRMHVVEASDGMAVQPGTVYIAPGDFHMRVSRTAIGARIIVDQAPPENSCRPAADPLFRSAVDVWGAGVLAVVLTGMGSDGCQGCERVVGAGGRVIAQDEASSVVWGMPGAVVRAGFADVVVPLSGVANEILRAAATGRPTVGTR